MQENFRIKQNLSLVEYYIAALYLGVRNRRLRKVYYMVFAIPLLMLVFEIFLPHHNWNEVISTFALLLLVPVAFFYASLFLMSCLLILTKPSLVKNITFEFNHWGMIKNTRDNEYSTPWRGFIKFRETKRFFLLYVTENDAHIIQKRMFSDPGERENFRKFADQNIWSNDG
jgi:YcxB-like protein